MKPILTARKDRSLTVFTTAATGAIGGAGAISPLVLGSVAAAEGMDAAKVVAAVSPIGVQSVH